MGFAFIFAGGQIPVVVRLGINGIFFGPVTKSAALADGIAPQKIFPALFCNTLDLLFGKGSVAPAGMVAPVDDLA